MKLITKIWMIFFIQYQEFRVFRLSKISKISSPSSPIPLLIFSTKNHGSHQCPRGLLYDLNLIGCDDVKIVNRRLGYFERQLRLFIFDQSGLPSPIKRHCGLAQTRCRKEETKSIRRFTSWDASRTHNRFLWQLQRYN